MPDVYYDSTLTGQELDEALKKIPLIDKAVEDAQKSAKASESWAQGGTDTREGENEDNAEYWAGQAKSSAATASAGAQVVTDNQEALDAVKDNIEAIQSAPDNALRAEAAAEDAGASAEAAEAAAKNAQSIAQGQKGYFATEDALRAAVPEGHDGDWAIVGETDTVWVWDSDASEWSNSGNKTDLSLYYTKNETDTKLGSYYTKKEVDKKIAEVIDSIYNDTARKITKKEDMDALFVKWWHEADAAAGGNRPRLELLERWFGRVLADDRIHGVKLPLYSTSTVPTGELLGDSVGLTCTPSTATVAGRDDFAGLPQFWCVEASVEKTEPGSIDVYAVEFIDDLDTVRSGQHLCWVLQKNTFMRHYNADGYQFLYMRSHAAAGYTQWKEGTTKDGTTHAFAGRPKYMAGVGKDGKITCGTNLAPLNYTDGPITGVTMWRNRGKQYAGADSATLFWQWAMFALKYAKKGNSGTIEGCSAYNFQYAAAAGETGVKRVLLTDAQAANLLVGSCVHVGEPGANTNVDRGQASMYSKAKNCKITAIEKVTVGSAAYTAVYVDAPAAFDTVAASTRISTMPYWSGYNDGILGNDGSRTNYTNGKEPGTIQKTEFLVGAFLILAGELWQWGTDAEGNFTFDCFQCDDQAKVTTNGTISADYKKVEGATLVYPSTQKRGWQGIEDIMPSPGGRVMWPKSSSTGAGSTTGCMAGLFVGPAASGVRAGWCCCSLDGGWICGVAARNSNPSAGASVWHGLVGAPGMAG